MYDDIFEEEGSDVIGIEVEPDEEALCDDCDCCGSSCDHPVSDTCGPDCL